jgi:hypothetical protein
VEGRIPSHQANLPRMEELQMAKREQVSRSSPVSTVAKVTLRTSSTLTLAGLHICSHRHTHTHTHTGTHIPHTWCPFPSHSSSFHFLPGTLTLSSIPNQLSCMTYSYWFYLFCDFSGLNRSDDPLGLTLSRWAPPKFRQFFHHFIP